MNNDFVDCSICGSQFLIESNDMGFTKSCGVIHNRHIALRYSSSNELLFYEIGFIRSNKIFYISKYHTQIVAKLYEIELDPYTRYVPLFNIEYKFAYNTDTAKNLISIGTKYIELLAFH
jgi:hypothetical protein